VTTMAPNVATRDRPTDTPDTSSALLAAQQPLGVLPDAALAPVYGRKAHVLNAAIQKIGMGRYQWGLFCVAGFGWLADSVGPPPSALREDGCLAMGADRRDSCGHKSRV